MVRQGAGIPVAVAISPSAPVVTGGGFLHARSIYDHAQEPHPNQERTMTAAWTIFWVLFFTALAWLTFTGGDK